jgi:hypothetical protein
MATYLSLKLKESDYLTITVCEGTEIDFAKLQTALFLVSKEWPNIIRLSLFTSRDIVIENYVFEDFEAVRKIYRDHKQFRFYFKLSDSFEDIMSKIKIKLAEYKAPRPPKEAKEKRQQRPKEFKHTEEQLRYLKLMNRS